MREQNRFEKAIDYISYLVYFGPIAIPLILLFSPFIIIWAIYYYVKVLRPMIK